MPILYIYSLSIANGQAQTEIGEDAKHTDGGLDHAQLAENRLAQHSGNQDRGGKHQFARDNRPRHGPEHSFCQPVADR